MEYLFDLGFTLDEINSLKKIYEVDEIDKVSFFPRIVKENYNYLNSYGIKNIKLCFINHLKFFLMNPDKFKAVFIKYDKNDLVRCIEKNDAVLEKL